MKPRLILFDFDGTITSRDSLIPFLWHISNPFSFTKKLTKSLPYIIGYLLKIISNERAKDRLLKHFLIGRDLEELRALCKSYVENALPNLIRPTALTAIQNHKSTNDLCVLISASPDLYLNVWGKIQQFDYILTTEIATDNSMVTGGISGKNCYGSEKLKRIKETFPDLSQYFIVVYGDSKGDFDLFEIADEVHYKPFRS